MADPRVYVDIALAAGERVNMPDAAYHHLIVVLRRIRGDPITLFNGHGGEYGAVIETVGNRSMQVRITEFRDVSRESPLTVTLAQAVSKGERMDFTIQKAVELGVNEIQPLVTDHVVVRLNEERWLRKREHWQSIAVSACEQSGRTRVPRVAPVLDMRDWLSGVPAEALKFVLAPGAPAPATPARAAPGTPVVLLVGPEGGLSDMEMKLADIANFLPLPLGPRTLRTETAGMVALAMIQSLWGDLGSSFNNKR